MRMGEVRFLTGTDTNGLSNIRQINIAPPVTYYTMLVFSGFFQ